LSRVKLVKYLLFLLFLFLSSCTSTFPSNLPTHHYHVFISPAFPSKIAPIILSSFKEWQSHLRGLVEFETSNDFDGCLDDAFNICVQPATPAEIHNQAGSTLSDMMDHNAVIKLSTDNWAMGVSNWEECVHITSLHEIGHALGLRHDRHNTIMCPTGDFVAHEITERDVQQYLRLRGIR
jgi:hypothetical protein